MSGKVSVLLDGMKKPVKIPLNEGITNVADAIVDAAKTLGFAEFDVTVITPVVNSEDATLEDPVKDGDEITSTTNVENGAG